MAFPFSFGNSQLQKFSLLFIIFYSTGGQTQCLSMLGKFFNPCTITPAYLFVYLLFIYYNFHFSVESTYILTLNMKRNSLHLGD